MFITVAGTGILSTLVESKKYQIQNEKVLSL